MKPLPDNWRQLDPSEPLQDWDWIWLKAQGQWSPVTAQTPRIEGATYIRWTGPNELTGLATPNQEKAP